jgi:SAM-dependent methyltransferase
VVADKGWIFAAQVSSDQRSGIEQRKSDKEGWILRPRVILAYLMVRLGTLIDRFALMIMRPDDLVAFTRRHYGRPDVVDAWCSEGKVSEGLHAGEENLLEAIPRSVGRVLVLGAGGGRESIALAQRGYAVTAVDFVSEMVAKTHANAEKLGVHVSAKVENFLSADFSPQAYEIVWLCAGTYSSIPSTERRIGFLTRVRHALVPGGHFLCQLIYYPQARVDSRLDSLGKVFAQVTRGNVGYEEGDMLSGKCEFVHCFASKIEITTEFQRSGFEVLRLIDDTEAPYVGAVLLNPTMDPAQ